MPIGIIFISLLFMVWVMIIQSRVKSKFSTYYKIPAGSALSGKEISENMVHDNGIFDVTRTSAPGFLSDYFDSAEQTVNLDTYICEGRNISAASLATHECGHLIQHATACSMLKLRSGLVLVVQISSKLARWIALIGLGHFSFGGGNPSILLVGIIIFAASTVFSVVTLPVDFGASARALKGLRTSHLTSPGEYDRAKDALKGAALTYVIAALTSIALLTQYILI